MEAPKPMKWKVLFEALKKIRKTYKIQAIHINTEETDEKVEVAIHFMKRSKPWKKSK